MLLGDARAARIEQPDAVIQRLAQGAIDGGRSELGAFLERIVDELAQGVGHAVISVTG